MLQNTRCPCSSVLSQGTENKHWFEWLLLIGHSITSQKQSHAPDSPRAIAAGPRAVFKGRAAEIHQFCCKSHAMRVKPTVLYSGELGQALLCLSHWHTTPPTKPGLGLPSLHYSRTSAYSSVVSRASLAWTICLRWGVQLFQVNHVATSTKASVYYTCSCVKDTSLLLFHFTAVSAADSSPTPPSPAYCGLFCLRGASNVAPSTCTFE